MTNRTAYTVTISLLSDAIIGSGQSIPGGEDIAVRRNAQGYPYILGSTVKGLLRESMENLAAWTDADPKVVERILGKEQRGWSDDTHRLTLSNFQLLDPPDDSALCCDQRTFTQLEGGIIQAGSLRVAACVLAGYQFTGTMECADADRDFVEKAFSGIRHLGTMRSRGFGHVQFTLKAIENKNSRETENSEESEPVSGTGSWVSYVLHSLTGLALTDSGRSTDDSAATHGYIPGSAIRGMVLNTLAQEDPQWFDAHRRRLLTQVRFLDALPNPLSQKLTAIPTIMGFYEDKQEQVFESIFPSGSFSAGLKRASLGSFCALEQGKVRYWHARTDGTVRIKRDVQGKEKQMFHTQYLSAGQDFAGYIAVEDPALRERIARVFQRELWLGADRYEGFGHCRVEQLRYCEAPKWMEAYGSRTAQATFYMMALSPLTMYNDWGEPCGIHTPALAEALGVEDVRIDLSASSVSEYSSYNRILESHLPPVRMYDRGSVFKITCTTHPSPEALQRLQHQGLGIRREEGCGMVLILPESTFTGDITGKEKYTPEKTGTDNLVRQHRREEVQWLQKHRRAFAPGEFTMSRSQIGTLQTKCSDALKRNNLSILDDWLTHSMTNTGGKKTKAINARDTIYDVLENRDGTVPRHLKTWQQRLQLVIRLMDYGRKGENSNERRV